MEPPSYETQSVLHRFEELLRGSNNNISGSYIYDRMFYEVPYCDLIRQAYPTVPNIEALAEEQRKYETEENQP